MSTISGDVAQPTGPSDGGAPPLTGEEDPAAFEEALVAQSEPQAQGTPSDTDVLDAPSSEVAGRVADLIQDLPGVGAEPDEPGTYDPTTGAYRPPNADAEDRLKAVLGVPVDARIPQGAPLQPDPEAVATFQDAVRTAYYEGKLSTADLADFVAVYTEVGADFVTKDNYNQIGIETILGTENTGLIKNVALELYDRASQNDPELGSAANDALRSNHYALAFRALDAVADAGDTSVSERVLSDLSRGGESLQLAVTGALDASAPGALDFLVGETTSRAEAGLLEPDLADEVLQTVLASSNGGALLQPSSAAREDLVDYVLANFDRIVDESVFPRSGTDTGAFVDREINDGAFLEDIVTTLMLNPGVSEEKVMEFGEKIEATLDAAFETATDPDSTAGQRRKAAQTIGFVQTAYSEGFDRAEASQRDYSDVITYLVGAGFDFIPAVDIPNRVIKQRIDDVLGEIESMTEEEASGRIAEVLGVGLQDRDEMLRSSFDFEAAARLPDPNEAGVDLDLALDLDQALQAGRQKAEAARPDLPQE